MRTQSVIEKLRWITSVEHDRSEAFYPSLVRRLEHTDQEFCDQFSTDHKEITVNDFLNEILPLYDQEIASRENYIFTKDQLRQKYLKRMTDGRRYFLLGFYDSNSKRLVGGYLYSIQNDLISLAIRVFDRDVNKNTKHQVTIDFWAEWVFYDFVKSQGHKRYSLGVDHYPNIDRAGLPLYKLKVGSLPFRTETSEEVPLDLETIQFDKQLVFFSGENPSGQMTKMNCMYKFEQPGGVIDELEKITEWAGIVFDKTKI